MSHTFAARCTVCGRIDDPMCPECGTPSSDTHGTTTQRPYHQRLADGYVHEWHPACVPTTHRPEESPDE